MQHDYHNHAARAVRIYDLLTNDITVLRRCCYRAVVISQAPSRNDNDNDNETDEWFDWLMMMIWMVDVDDLNDLTE